jgi:CRP/FNR family transcriptional regulator
MNDVLRLQDIKRACGSCSLRELCLPYGINEEDLRRLESIVQRKRPITKGQRLFTQGDPLAAIYAVRMGSVKSFTVSQEGAEQVTGFHFPGELVGLDAIADEIHDCTVVALESTSVCEIDFDEIDHLSDQVPGLKRQLMRLLSREIIQDQKLLLMLGKKTAEARLATLLISLSTRFELRGLSSQDFNLSMSRGDIANYLGLALETVSRLFARFQDDGLITVDGRSLHIIDLIRVHQLAEGGEGSAVRQRL